MKRFPKHNTTECKLKPGSQLYLVLFHGRKTPDEELEDWGSDGPCIPIEGFHTTYGEHKVHLSPLFPIERWPEMEAIGFTAGSPDNWLEIPFKDGLLKCNGIYYGDWYIIAREPFNFLR